MIRALSIAVAALIAVSPAAAEPLRVAETAVDDLKAVFGTVESIDTVIARTRLGGTVGGLSIDEGSAVEQGQVLAIVRDEKLPLQQAALDAQVTALESQMAQAETDLERARRLRESGTIPQARLDDAQTAVNVVTAQLAAMGAERAVVRERIDEAAVVAPAGGRVLAVHVVNGTVVMPGEPVAAIAADSYILRLYLPERHARFIDVGDPVLVGGAGLAAAGQALREGTVRQVYPELSQGRVVADVTVSGLGDFFVGERTRVFVTTGQRSAIVVPAAYLYQRFNLDYVRLEDGREVVVRTGLPVPGGDGIEILSGLRPGDVIVLPSDRGDDA
ncbi:MAG: efflux RND transporter periplasmic adaptor subunit [Inquilinus sp.]|nr:efflux RND transporter periplasmic adaptor subunit [Inquilinus sp.]